jgi:hypothetical protein
MLQLVKVSVIVFLASGVFKCANESDTCYKHDRISGKDYIILSYSDSSVYYVSTTSKYDSESEIIIMSGKFNKIDGSDRYEILLNSTSINDEEVESYDFYVKYGEIEIKKLNLNLFLSEGNKRNFKMTDCSIIKKYQKH